MRVVGHTKAYTSAIMTISIIIARLNSLLPLAMSARARCPHQLIHLPKREKITTCWMVEPSSASRSNRSITRRCWGWAQGQNPLLSLSMKDILYLSAKPQIMGLSIGRRLELDLLRIRRLTRQIALLVAPQPIPLAAGRTPVAPTGKARVAAKRADQASIRENSIPKPYIRSKTSRTSAVLMP